MRKAINFFCLILSCLVILNTCVEPEEKTTVKKASETTEIFFDNTGGICDVSVYSYFPRSEGTFITKVPAGQKSKNFNRAAGDSVPFLLTYHINIKGLNAFSIDYVPWDNNDQIYVRIVKNKLNEVKIPSLNNVISSNDQKLSQDSYIIIQNNSEFPVRLIFGKSVLVAPDNAQDKFSYIFNAGERAIYTIVHQYLPPKFSSYELMQNLDSYPLEGTFENLEKGCVYSFTFDGSRIFLSSEVEIKLENVENVSHNTPVPAAPSKPVVTSYDGFLTVRWAAVKDAETYEVYTSSTQTPPSVPARTVNGTTVVLDRLINETNYYVWVKAVNSAGASDYSPYSLGIPWAANKIPAVPQKPVITPGIHQLTVTWNETGGAASYEVFFYTSPDRPALPEITTDKITAVISNLENEVNYFFWIRAKNSTGYSDYSAMEVGTPQIPTIAPVSPARPELTAGSRTLNVFWQTVALAENYQVWYGTTAASAQAQKFGNDISGNITETVITGLENEKTYYVWIKAINRIGASSFSLSASARPSAFAVTPDAPETPQIVFGSKELTISWLPVEGVLFYEVWSGTSNNPSSAQKHGADLTDTNVTLHSLLNGTTYYIWIKAKNNIGVSAFSPMASGTPSALAAIPVAHSEPPSAISGDKQLSISWKAAEGAASYELWMADTNNLTSAVKQGDVTGLSVVVTGLTNGTTYYVWIKGKNNIGESGFSPVGSGIPSVFSVAPVAPSAPVAVIGNSTVTLTWTAVAGAMSYEVYMGTSNNSASASKYGNDISDSLTVTVNGLTNGTTYYFWLRAKNNSGASGYSPSASAKPIANAGIPTISAGNGQLTATWSAIAGAEQYEVFAGTGVNPPDAATQTVSAASATITGLTNGTTYNVWVRGKNTTGTGAISASANAKPIGNMGTVTVSAGGSGELVLNWTAVAGADEYEVFQSTSNSMPASAAQTVSSMSATISGLTNGALYYVWVRPKNANGNGGASTSVSGRPIAVPENLAVVSSNQQITLSWSSVTGASSYEVYFNTSYSIPSTPSYTGITQTSRIITGLSNGTTYYFWVKAVNANGISGASSVISGKPIGNMGAVTVTLGASGEIILTWTEVAGANEYDVFQSTTNTMPTSSAQTVTTNTVTRSGLTNGTTYYFWVRAKNTSGNHTSAFASGTPMATPDAPTLIVGLKQLHVTWASVPGASEYEVYYGTTSTPTTLAGTITETSTIITELNIGTTYYVRIRAKNSNGFSAYSNTVNEILGSPGLYRNGEKIGNQNLSTSLSYISSNAVSGDEFAIVLGADESIAPTTLDYSNKTVGITLVGYGQERTINLASNGRMFTVNSGVTLTLDENITLVGRSENTDSVINCLGGSLVINKGSKISGNTALSSHGGGVYISGGTFTMNGGIISGNTTRNTNSVSGGGVCVSSGTFTMNGGTISGNTAVYGGGVYISDGTFTMNEGTISGNTASRDGGGGVYVRGSFNYYGTFTMNGGTISGNTASNDDGGGVYVRGTSNYYGTFTMNGGTISGNTASFGGGVYVSSSGIFIKQGTQSGIIYGNEASATLRNTAGSDSNGHAVYYSSSSLKRSTTANQSDQINTATGQGLSANGNAPFSNGSLPTSTTSLFENQWINGDMTSSSGGEVWYSFAVTSGTIYRVWLDDSWQSSGSKTLDINASAFYNNGTIIFNMIDSAWNAPRTFTASSSGTVYIRVTPYSSGGTGTFGIVYSTGSTRPAQ